MIISALFSVLFNVVFIIVGMLPSTFFSLPDWSVYTLKFLKTGLSIFPKDVWMVCVGNGMFWLSVHFVWAIIEWLYKKIPGIS